MTHTIALTTPAIWNPARVDAANTDERTLDQFLKSVERRALRMAELATGNRDEALDLVQDAMFGFARHYAAKPAADWAPLFYRVLDSRLNDWHRRRSVRSRWLAVWTRNDDDDEHDEIAQAPDTNDPGPLGAIIHTSTPAGGAIWSKWMLKPCANMSIEPGRRFGAISSR